MEEKIKAYIDSLFSGRALTDDLLDIKNEITQNTLERYRNLISEGKSPQEAYKGAVSNIGDVDVLMNEMDKHRESDTHALNKRYALFLSSAIALYIISFVPGIIWDNDISAVMMIAAWAVATFLIVYANITRTQTKEPFKRRTYYDEVYDIEIYRVTIRTLWIVIFGVYMALSFWTSAWFYTWLIFPMAAAIQNIIKIIFIVKGRKNNEKQ